MHIICRLESNNSVSNAFLLSVLSYSTVFSANTNIRSIASKVVSCVLPTLFILHDNYCVFMHIGAEVCPLCTRQINLHKRMMQPPTPLKTFSLTKPTNMNNQCEFPRRGKMVVLLDVSALVAVKRRPTDASLCSVLLWYHIHQN